MSQTSNEAQTQCFIETPIVILIGEQNTPLVFNILANILLTFTAVLGNVSILFSFVFVSILVSFVFDGQRSAWHSDVSFLAP